MAFQTFSMMLCDDRKKKNAFDCRSHDDENMRKGVVVKLVLKLFVLFKMNLD